VVFVLDTEKGQFYPYDGTKIRYDGVSIPESAIWSHYPDPLRGLVVLIAQSGDSLAKPSVG